MTAAQQKYSLEKILSGAQLPALPQSAIRLMELSQDPDNGPPEYAVPIEADPGLTSQVLRFVNSSYFGFSREIDSVRQAITLVGIRTIKNFALWSAVYSLMPNPQCGPFDLRRLWQDSLRRGLFARAVGKLLGLTECEELFSAGLLQDMAIPLLAKELPEQYAALLQARQKSQLRLSLLEQKVFGWSHAEAGAAMARSWKLPDQFAALIERHIHLSEILEEKASSPARLAAALSSHLPSTFDDSWAERDVFEKACEKMFASASQVEELLATVDVQFGEFAPVLRIAKPAKSLVQWYEESLATS